MPHTVIRSACFHNSERKNCRATSGATSGVTGAGGAPAGLDYPGVGPEHSYYKATGRASYVAVKDIEALKGFKMLSEIEGIIPALESSHALFYAAKLAPILNKNKIMKSKLLS